MFEFVSLPGLVGVFSAAVAGGGYDGGVLEGKFGGSDALPL